MPYAKKKKTYRTSTYKKKRAGVKYHKRHIYKKRGASGPFNALTKAMPFPPSKYCKLRYSQLVVLTTGTAGVFGTEQVFNLNSLYDPDFSGLGHQPYGFDQMAALYRFYKVNGVLIQMSIFEPSNDDLVFGACVQPSTATTTITGNVLDTIQEQQTSLTRYVSNTGSQKAYIKQFFRINVIEGLTKLQFSDQDYAAEINANPYKTPYLRMAVGSSGANSGHTVKVMLTLTYYCKFNGIRTFSQS